MRLRFCPRFAIFIFCFSSLLFCEAKNTEIDGEIIKLYQKAIKNYLAEDYQNSLVNYYSIIALDAHQEEARNQIQKIQSRLTAVNNRRAGQFQGEALQLLQEGRIKQALEKIIQADRLSPDNKDITELKEFIQYVHNKISSDYSSNSQKSVYIRRVINNVLEQKKDEAVDLVLYLSDFYKKSADVEELNKLAERKFPVEYADIKNKIMENKCTLIEYRDMCASNLMQSRQYVNCIQECDKILAIVPENAEAYEKKTYAYLWLFINTPPEEAKIRLINLENVKINLRKAFALKPNDISLKNYFKQFEALQWNPDQVRELLAREAAQ